MNLPLHHIFQVVCERWKFDAQAVCQVKVPYCKIMLVKPIGIHLEVIQIMRRRMEVLFRTPHVLP